MKGAKFGREEQNLPSPQQMDRGLGTDTPIPSNPKHFTLLHVMLRGWLVVPPPPPALGQDQVKVPH